jgi:hypothetical protein
VDSATLTLDKAGPTVTGAIAVPNPGQGRTDVTITVTGTDVASGNQAVTQAEFTVDGGLPIPMTMAGSPAPVRIASGTYPGSVGSPQPEGDRTIQIRARDILGNWGPYTTLHLIVDRTGPTATGLGILPTGPNNGTRTYDINTFAIKVNATITDGPGGSPGSQTRITAAEGFIDVVGAPGTGFVFLPADGAWTSSIEAVYQTIPLSAVQALSQGPHQVHVRGRDLAGNWGPVNSVTLIIDKTGPAISGASASPNPTSGAASVVLSGTATDPANGAAPASTVVAGEWFESSDPGAGNGHPMSAADGTFNSSIEGVMASIDVSGWADGNHPVRLRARDAAGNWGPTSTVTVVVTPPATFVPLAPARLLDTRVANGLAGTFSANTPRTFQVSGRGGVPADAVAVTGNLTVTGQTAAGFVFLGPTPTASPTSSTLNFPLADTRANGLTVALSPSGTLSAVYGAPAGKTTHLVFDVTGYFTDGP